MPGRAQPGFRWPLGGRCGVSAGNRRHRGRGAMPRRGERWLPVADPWQGGGAAPSACGLTPGGIWREKKRSVARAAGDFSAGRFDLFRQRMPLYRQWGWRRFSAGAGWVVAASASKVRGIHGSLRAPRRRVNGSGSHRSRRVRCRCNSPRDLRRGTARNRPHRVPRQRDPWECPQAPARAFHRSVCLR